MGWFDSTYQNIARPGDFSPPVLVSPQEFILQAQRAPKMVGRPVIYSVWPTTPNNQQTKENFNEDGKH